MTISNSMNMTGSSLKGKKTLWEKEKLLVMSNFSFSHSVFKRLVLQTRKNQGLFGKGLTLSQTTNFRLFQTERVSRRQLEIWRNGRRFSKRVENTEEQFLLYPQCFQKTCAADTLKPGLVLEKVNSFPNKPWFLCVCRRILLKSMREKEKLLVTSNFSFSHSVFYPYGELPAVFIELKIVACQLFHFGRV